MELKRILHGWKKKIRKAKLAFVFFLKILFIFFRQREGERKKSMSGREGQREQQAPS